VSAPPAPDLALSLLSVSANSVAAGEAFNVRVRLVNGGGLAAGAYLTAQSEAGNLDGPYALGEIPAGADQVHELAMTFTCRSAGGNKPVVLTAQAGAADANPADNQAQFSITVNNSAGTSCAGVNAVSMFGGFATQSLAALAVISLALGNLVLITRRRTAGSGP
jgi:hypothetical protein